MDTDRSDRPDPPDPGSSAASATAAEEAEAPKVVEWEELQEELARLWSLSSAAHEAKERKDALTRRIESILKVPTVDFANCLAAVANGRQVREESLRQRYVLQDMRQKLNITKTALEDLRIRTEKASKDADGKREQLCLQIRTLLVAAENLSTAQQQLQEANNLLAAKMGRDQLKNVERMIRMKQQYLVALVAAIYPVEAINEQSPGEKPDLHFGGDIGSPSKDVPKPPALSSLTILGLQLTMFPKMSIFGDKKELQKSATILGYVAHDLEQLLNYIGAESLGPRHVLANLWELIRTVLSEEYINS